MEVDGVPVVTVAYPRTVRLVTTARLRAPVLAPLVDSEQDLAALAEIEGATSARLMAQSVGISGLQPNELLSLGSSEATVGSRGAGSHLRCWNAVCHESSSRRSSPTVDCDVVARSG